MSISFEPPDLPARSPLPRPSLRAPVPGAGTGRRSRRDLRRPTGPRRPDGIARGQCGPLQGGHARRTAARGASPSSRGARAIPSRRRICSSPSETRSCSRIGVRCSPRWRAPMPSCATPGCSTRARSTLRSRARRWAGWGCRISSIRCSRDRRRASSASATVPPSARPTSSPPGFRSRRRKTPCCACRPSFRRSTPRSAMPAASRPSTA
jgi:hypothetical protein